ncbi:MAG TPA: hypothetical protein VH482_10320 [Thermomicrobiales bacterium]|jgi:hypothetical protein
MNESNVETGSVGNFTMGEESRDFAAPLGGATAGKLEIVNGATKVVLRTESAMSDLVRAHFEGPTPEVEARSGIVTIRYPRFAPAEWIQFGLLRNKHAADVVLNTTIPWTVVIDRGVTKLEADLSALRLSSFEIDGGASDVELTLPKPLGVVQVRIGGGVSKFTIHRPAGVPVRVQIKGGASQFALDDQRFGAIGGETRMNSQHDQNAPDRYEIAIGGGASRLTID